MLVFIFALLFQLAAASLTISIPPSTNLPNPHVLPATTHATLTTLPQEDRHDHILTTPLTRSSTLVFRNIPSGAPESYILEIRSAGFVFAPYRVDVAADGSILGIWETFRGNPWDNRGAEKYVVDVANKRTTNVVVEAKILGRKGFYEERAKCEYSFHGLSFLFPTPPAVRVSSTVQHCILTYKSPSLTPQPRQEPNDSPRHRRPRLHPRHAEAHGEQYVLPSQISFLHPPTHKHTHSE